MTTEMTMTEQPITERSPITNRWGSARRTKKLPARETLIYRAVEGAAYDHHQQITSLDGRLYATWSNGVRDEDMNGQRMMLATSDDGGETWSEPRPLVEPEPGRHGPAVITAEGIHVHDGTLVAYYGHYDLTYHGILMYYAAGGNQGMRYCDEPFHVDIHCGIMVSRDRGATWEGPVERIPGFVPNLGPSPTASGRLILPGNLTFPHTDDPAGISGWTVAGVPGSEGMPDDPESHVRIMKKTRKGRLHVSEGSFFQTDDGVIHMMLRTGEGRLAESRSADDGATWSEPALTDFTDAESRTHFGRLPDGRFFGLSNPDPGSVRTPLVLAASDDGVAFDTHYVVGDEENHLSRITGVHKYGRYGYPHLHIMDGTAFVIYSINKEDVALSRFPLSALD